MINYSVWWFCFLVYLFSVPDKCFKRSGACSFYTHQTIGACAGVCACDGTHQMNKTDIFVFLHSLRIVISFHRYIAGKTYSFPKAWPMYNKIKANMGWIVSCVLSIIFTHIWLQNMLRSLNTVRVILLCFYHSFYFF